MAKYLDREGLQKSLEIIKQYVSEQDNTYLNVSLDNMYDNIVVHNTGDNMTPDGSKKYTYGVLDISSRIGKKTAGVRETISFADYSTTFDGHYTPVSSNGTTVLNANATAGAVTSKESVANYIKSITFDKKGHVLSITSEAVPIKYYNGLDNLSNFEENSYAGFDFISSTGAYNLYNYVKNNYMSIFDSQHIGGNKTFDNQVSMIGGTYVSAQGNSGYLIVGNPAIASIGIDNNDIQARTQDIASSLFLQQYGGDTYIGDSLNTHIFLNSSVYVNKPTAFNDNIIVNGTTTLTDTNINGNENISGYANITGNINVTGISYLNNDTHVSGNLIENKDIILTGETASNIRWQANNADTNIQRIHTNSNGSFVFQKSTDLGVTWTNNDINIGTLYSNNIVANSSISTVGYINGGTINSSGRTTTNELVVNTFSTLNGLLTANSGINTTYVVGTTANFSSSLTTSYINIDSNFDISHAAGHVPYAGSTISDTSTSNLQNFLIANKSGFYSGNTYNVISLRNNNGSTVDGMYLKTSKTDNSIVLGNNTGGTWNETNILTEDNSSIVRENSDKVNITVNNNTETIDLSSYFNTISDIDISYSPISTFVTNISYTGHNVVVNHITLDALRQALHLTQPLVFKGTLRSATITGDNTPIIDYSATTPIPDNEEGKLNDKSATIILNETDGADYKVVTPSTVNAGDIVVDIITGTEYMWTGTVWAHLGQDKSFLHTTGGSMTGDITMGTHAIKGINNKVILQNTDTNNVLLGTTSSVTTIYGNNDLMHNTSIIYDSANVNKGTVDWSANVIHTNKIINDLTTYTLQIGVKSHDNSIYISYEGNIGIGTSSLNTNNLLTVAGNQYVNGEITSHNIMPDSTDTRTIGSSIDVWNNIYSTTFTGSLTGNASTATKLATPITIWGQNYDGSGNVDGTFTLGGSNGFTISDMGTYRQIQSLGNVPLSINTLGNKVGIGIDIPLYGLDVNGDARVVSNLMLDANVGTRNFSAHTTGWQITAAGSADFRNLFASSISGTSIYQNNNAVWDASSLYRLRTTIDANNDTTDGVTDTLNSESIIGAFLKAGFTLAQIGLSTQL